VFFQDASGKTGSSVIDIVAVVAMGLSRYMARRKGERLAFFLQLPRHSNASSDVTREKSHFESLVALSAINFAGCERYARI